MKELYSRLSLSLVAILTIGLIATALILNELIKLNNVEQYEQAIEQEKELVSAYLGSKSDSDLLIDDIVKDLNENFDSFLLKSRPEQLLNQLNQQFDLREQAEHNINHWLEQASEDQVEILRVKNNRQISFFLSELDYSSGQLINDSLYLVSLADPLNEQLKTTTKQVFSTLLISLFVIIFFSATISQRAIKASSSATETLEELARGDFKRLDSNLNSHEVTNFNKTVNQLVNTLEKLSQEQRIQQERLTTLMENIGASLIFIDGHGLINLVNRPYRENFVVKDDNYLNKPYYQVIESEEVNGLIAEIFMTEQKLRRQIILPIGIERRYFEVYGAPIIGEKGSWKGTLLVFHDITGLKRLEKMRKDFVANVSHELKTPVTSIKGFSETLLDGASQDEEVLQSFLSIILTESNRLQILLQDLLDLSTIEADNFILANKTFNIAGLVKEITTLLDHRAKEKNIQLIEELPEREMLISADHERIKQLLLNLVNNAITYTPEDGIVTIKLSSLTNKIRIEVIDSGIGIAQAEIPRIFERFYRVDKARSRNSGGTGLGLAIVKHITEAHQGEITVDSELGKGTNFTIMLPNNLDLV